MKNKEFNKFESTKRHFTFLKWIGIFVYYFKNKWIIISVRSFFYLSSNCNIQWDTLCYKTYLFKIDEEKFSIIFNSLIFRFLCRWQKKKYILLSCINIMSPLNKNRNFFSKHGSKMCIFLKAHVFETPCTVVWGYWHGKLSFASRLNGLRI